MNLGRHKHPFHCTKREKVENMHRDNSKADDELQLAILLSNRLWAGFRETLVSLEVIYLINIY